MAKRIVKCKICGEKFDINSVQGVKCGARRYAHYQCFPSGELEPLGPQADPNLKKLRDYISQIYGSKANWPTINTQIKRYKEENNYTYSGMLKSLIYFYDVQGHSVDKTNGSIGIIPHVYKAAYEYYYNLFLTQQNNQNVTLTNQIKEITIKPPVSKSKKYNLFNLEDFEE